MYPKEIARVLGRRIKILSHIFFVNLIFICSIVKDFNLKRIAILKEIISDPHDGPEVEPIGRMEANSY